MDQDKIWDYYQNHEAADNASFGSAAARYRYFASNACRYAPERTGRVLNIGVGSGTVETLLQEAKREAYCLDPSAAAIEGLRDRLGLGDRAQTGYIQQLPFDDNLFDVVIVSEVLEHLTPEVGIAACHEMRRVLQPRGRLLGSVPADENLAASECVCPKCGETFHRWGHVRSFGEDSLRELLCSEFTDINIQREYFSDPDRLNWKGRSVHLAKKLSLRLGVKGTSDSFVFSGSPA